jgi:hypothetical protein
VTNHGTSEHILNQWNVFEVMHDATKLGGLMVHGVPFNGEFEHGIISYMPKFFWALAKANDYEIDTLRLSVHDPEPPTPRFLIDAGFTREPAIPERIWAFVVLRKAKPGKFKGLTDPAFI